MRSRSSPVWCVPFLVATIALCAACAATPHADPAQEQSCTIRTTAAHPILDLGHRTINLLHGPLCLYPVTGAAAPFVTTAEKPPREMPPSRVESGEQQR